MSDAFRFVRERTPMWEELERLLTTIESRGARALDVAGARRFGRLYRAVSADLVRARAEGVDPAVIDHLNDLVARSYAQVHSGSGAPWSSIFAFFALELPRLVRAEWRAMALSAALLFGGVAMGAGAALIDPGVIGVLIPEAHAETTPDERVAHDEGRAPHHGDEAAAFSTFLFTHNIQVTFLVFALGITLGVGTAAVLVSNGIPLGALAVQYHLAGHGLFFWAWILPHGIPELTQIVIAGAAGLVIARGVVLPGRRARGDALRAEARRAARLVIGGMPILVLAGVIEGTISQMHEPAMPYVAKLVFAAVVGIALFAWLIVAGRGRAPAE
ncbi:stage II sporulation protein M [Sandaracinus amylolyticus]|uniref:stage II sporulation protein M n=1 Tax=Sandaracinus amylolyticus TaxID=927083 RepID=UPI001F3E4125|nr:stage II sporulation protein M [Sandaracinus amylolyticus]UJR79631.1 Stage II sporulation protein M [Sandaracinus amylolyticus]